MNPEISVVVVDDDPEFADLAADLLERSNDRFVVSVYHRAREALDQLADGTVDCVISDYEMPGLDGVEFLEALRERYPALPFILFTGKGTEAVASEAISAGVTDYLQKGAGRDQFDLLANRVENAVRGARARRSAERFQRLSEAFPDVIFHIDSTGRYLEVIAGESNLSRFDDSTALVGQRFQDFLPVETAETFRSAITEAIETGETRRIEYGFDDDSGPRWMEGRIVPLAETKTDEPGVLWAARDITEQKAREASERKYQHLVDAMQDPVCIYDTDGCYEVVNQHLADKYGTTKADLVGTPSQLVDLIRRVEDGDPFQELLDGDREEFTGEFESFLPGREEMECRLTRFIQDGQCEGVVLVSRDITERRRRERKLERTNRRLADFAKILSHDLRNPLNVASGRTELAQEECESQHLVEIDAALDRMASIIDDVLVLAREDQPVTDPETVDLATVADHSWRNVSTEDLELVIDTPGALLADPNGLQQLLENLYRNAVEHGGEVTCVRIGELPGGFFVEDDGDGIPAADRELVFDSGYSTAADGTGFGLDIVSRIADAHDWAVSITEGTAGGARLEITGVSRPTESTGAHGAVRDRTQRS